jgi:hypothetical protein
MRRGERERQRQPHADNAAGVLSGRKAGGGTVQHYQDRLIHNSRSRLVCGGVLHLAVDERCCSPNNSLKEPKVNNQSNNDFMHSMIFGKTYAFSH